MVDTLSSFLFSSEELTELTSWPQPLIEDWVNIAKNFKILSTNFQLLKDGLQATSSVYSPLADWVEDQNNFGFIFDSSSGSITLPEVGKYIFNIKISLDSESAIEIKIQSDIGAGFNDISSTITPGVYSACINSFIYDGSKSEKIRVMIKDFGSSSSVLPQSSYISIGRKA